MKRFRYAKPAYLTVVLAVCALALTVTAVFRLLHLIGVGNMVSFFPMMDVAIVITFLLVSGLAVYAIVGSGYYFGKTLRVVLGVPVFSVRYDTIERIVRTKDGALWLLVNDDGKNARLRVCLHEVDEADFLSAVRERKTDVTYETEI